MIEISLATAFTIYLFMALLLLLGSWVFQHLGSRHKKMIPSEHELMVCEFCHFAYLEEKIKDVTKCPQCQAFNKNNSYQASDRK